MGINDVSINVPFKVSSILEGHEGFQLELVPYRDDHAEEDSALVGYPVGIVRLSPLKETTAQQFDIDDQVVVTLRLAKKAE